MACPTYLLGFHTLYEGVLCIRHLVVATHTPSRQCQTIAEIWSVTYMVNRSQSDSRSLDPPYGMSVQLKQTDSVLTATPFTTRVGCQQVSIICAWSSDTPSSPSTPTSGLSFTCRELPAHTPIQYDESGIPLRRWIFM